MEYIHSLMISSPYTWSPKPMHCALADDDGCQSESEGDVSWTILKVGARS
jgi:hypothetical protein